MRTKAERRKAKVKEWKKRIQTCKDAHCYLNYADEDEYIKRKRDIPHGLYSNQCNPYNTKTMIHKRERLESKNKLKKEMENLE